MAEYDTASKEWCLVVEEKEDESKLSPESVAHELSDRQEKTHGAVFREDVTTPSLGPL